MALDREEQNRRRALREERQKRRQRARRRMYLRLAAAGLILVACGVGIFFMSRGSGTEELAVMATEAQRDDLLPEPTAAPTQERASWEKAPVTIHLAAAGDLNITDKVVWSGQNENSYDYTKAFMDVAPVFSAADLAIVNFEGNACGSPYGTATTSAPLELLQGLKNAGVDLLQMANSCAVNNGLNGLINTLASIRAAGLEPVGAFSSASEFSSSNGYTICNVGDVKIALVSFTKGFNGRGLPAGSEDCVNLLYEDYYTTYQTIDRKGIQKILRAVQNEKPDLTVALLHWGSEHNDIISDTQKDIVALMQAEGVDAIIGNHSHRVQQIDYNETTGQLVAYSLGDFFGDAKDSGTNYSIILDLEITKDYDTGVTRITDYSYTPIYTLSEQDCDGDRRVVRIENAMEAYEQNFVDKITASCYESMKTSLERISKRVNPKKDAK